MKYKFKFKKTKLVSKSNNDPLLILSHKKREIEQWIKDEFKGKTFEKFSLSAQSNHKNAIENARKSNPQFIITDNKKIFNKINDIDIYFYQGKKNDNDILVVSKSKKMAEKINPMFKEKINLIETNDNIFELIKNSSSKINKIIYEKENSLSIAYKIEGCWRYRSFDELLISYFNNNKISFNNNSDNSLPRILSKTNKINQYIHCNQNKIIVDEGFYETKDYKDIINWLISDLFHTDYFGTIQKKSFIYKETKFRVKEKNDYENVIKKIKDKTLSIGAPLINSFKFENKEIFKFAKGNLTLIKEGSNLIIRENLVSSDDEVQLITFSKNIKSNLINQINLNYQKSRISKNNVIKSILGIIALVFFSFLTFKYILDFENVKSAFEISFSKESLMMPWIYFAFMCFLFTLFLPFFIGLFIEVVVNKNKNPSFKRLFVYFEASFIRRASMLLTGNYFLSLFLWGWYLNKKTKIKATTLVGTISSMNLIRGILYSAIGSGLMISGTISYFLHYHADFTGSIIATFAISWLGFVWANMTHFWIFIIALSPAFHESLNRVIVKFKNKKITSGYLDSVYINTFLIRKSNMTTSIWKDKQRLTRVLLFIIVPIIIEGIETVIYFDMIDSLVLKESGYFDTDFSLYWDIISISGIRLVAANVTNFPLLNMIPAKGMGITEIALTSLYNNIFAFKHLGSEYVLGSYSVTDMSQMTTVMTRFFNSYLSTIVTTLGTAIIISMEVLRRHARKD